MKDFNSKIKVTVSFNLLHICSVSVNLGVAFVEFSVIVTAAISLYKIKGVPENTTKDPSMTSQ